MPACLMTDWLQCRPLFIFFFFNDTATTEIYTLSLHDALPIWALERAGRQELEGRGRMAADRAPVGRRGRSEEHTSELQSPCNLVCRLLLEKKKTDACLNVILRTTQQLVSDQRLIHRTSLRCIS